MAQETDLHSLLLRQLHRHGASREREPEDWGRFLEDVDSGYRQGDEDRRMLERSLELSSAELLQANADIRAVFDASEGRYRRLFERNLAGVYQASLDGTILDCNDSFARMLGYSGREELMASRVPARYAAPAERHAFLARLMERGSLTNSESTLARKDGSEVVILENVALLPGEPDGAVLLEGTVIDITERKRLEERVRKIVKMEAIGLLAGGVAHDFNNLLTTILGFTDLALRRLPEPSDVRSDLEEVVRAAERAATLTRQLLAFSRQQVLEPRVLDLNVVIDDLRKMLRRLLDEDYSLETRPDPDLPRVKADVGQIEQVLVNLVVNSRDAMANGGRIVIETASVSITKSPSPDFEMTAGCYARVSVVDTGQGMDPETRRRMFEPFFTTKAIGKGTGLGLATVYGIVKQSAGFIHVESAVGKGTRIDVYLPRDVGDAEPGRPASEAPRTRGTETILLAEDEAGPRGFLRRALEEHGYRVLVATSGEQALEVAAGYAGAIHLLFTDWIMPGMKGNELARRLLTERPGLKVIYCSGYAPEAYERGGVLDPNVPFLAKPIPLTTLLRRVRETLDREAEPPSGAGAVPNA